MKARNREINIFNMSLLDILCGALGAFCFMMLTLFPYYTANKRENPPPPPPAPPPASIPDGADTATLRAQIDKLNQQMAKLRQQQSQSQEQLQATQKKLDMREPLGVQAWWVGGDHDIDIYIQQLQTKQIAPDVTKKQPSIFGGDFRTDWTIGPGSETWMMSDTPISTQNLYFKVMDQRQTPNCIVMADLISSKGSMRLTGAAIVGSGRRLFMAGQIIIAAEHKISFYPSKEFLADRETVMKSGGK
jgi:hypothetical protein